jgi:hypothetical protein
VRRPDAIRAALACALLALVACGEKKEEQVQQAPAPVAAPVETVKAEAIEEVLARLGVDRRIRMEEAERPSSGDAAADQKRLESILKFFDAMLNAKADAIRPMLSSRDQATLDAMVADGQWKAMGPEVLRLNIGCAGPEVLAVFAIDDDFEGQLWTVEESRDNPDLMVFTAQPTLPGMMDKLSGTTAEPRIKQWMALTREWFEKAKEPDLPLESAQEDRSVKGEEPAPSGGQGAPPGNTPGAPPGKTP